MLKFERIQQQRHTLVTASEAAPANAKKVEQEIIVRYDRFTSRFEVIHQDKKLISQLIYCLPFKRFKFSIDQQDYQINISFFVVWQSTLYRLTPSSTSCSQDNLIKTKSPETKVAKIKPTKSEVTKTKVISELLPQRRRKSQLLACYVLMMSILKLSFIL
ncbi:hypothetical protein Q4557_07995 [Shewanella sp. 5_MG-2023]|uniref:hypothetical protein n=1 Tax=unclassified Shewanella TaxID=196818 RepID=UPI0026E1BB2E|nr:hypothetical protein [Shewanella sp. 5_MG-2023]MDO6639899.1 hypothetical protein [Shewanella sp. 5_MG-2023]